MENTAEGDLSSMANHSSGSGHECSDASEESGWTTYMDYFMERQQQLNKEASSTCTSPSTNGIGRSTSEHFLGDHGVGGAIASFAEASRLPALVDPSEVSKRLSFRKEGIRRKKLLYDESLEDTATSPISSPNLIDPSGSDDNHKKKEDASDENSHIAKNTTDELDCDNHIINDNGSNTSTDMISDDAYDHNELRKKGLCCLVPVSVFHV